MRIIEHINSTIKQENSLYYISEENFKTAASLAIDFINIARKDIGIVGGDAGNIVYEHRSSGQP
ncbi:hypothetical protein [Teredinibacter turnerae]|uniref:hypothetical protein n=1 Tax=Teredinibacter turnerae TaxID=2426 RepID=UPI00036AA9A9|nr:hypothetical protein [Teredinibacter turnerae]